MRLAAAGLDFQNLHEIVAKARQNLNQNDWDYIVGATETETTLRRNRLALDQLAFRPRVLRDVSRIDATVQQFGRRLRLPVMFAPVGALESFHAAAAAAVVRAARAFGVAHMLSSVCEPGLEKVAEAAPDGTFVVTKPEGSGGLVSVPVVAEQMLYEVGDPARYILPDVVCDFSDVRLEQVGENRVAVRGAKGLPPTDTYKVCATYPEGFRAAAQLTIVGFEAVAKCERTAAAILERTRRLFREAGYAEYSDTLIEVLGAESGHGPHASASPIQEAVLRLAVAHADKRALELFAREVAPAGTSWSTGTTGVGGRPSPSRVLKQYSFLLAKTRVAVRIVVDGQAMPIAIPAGHALALRELPAIAKAPVTTDANSITVPLIALAWARSGDKGDSCNVGVIARSPALVEYLRGALTAERVRDYLAHLVKGKVTRFDVPGIGAFNFLLEEALGGGGMASLRNDPWGKGMAQILLTMLMCVPAHLVPSSACGNTPR